MRKVGKLEGWKVEKLGDVCETRAGGTPLKSHKEYYVGGKIPWLLSGEVSQGEIYESKNFITEKGLKNSSATLFPSNTVLIAMYGATAGQVGILKFECSTNQAVCGIYPNKSLLPKFLYYCFLSKKDELISQAVGGAQPNISQLKIKNTLIPVIPLPEQQRIVSVLDEAFASIALAESNAERNLVNARELFEALLNEYFGHPRKGWKEMKLNDACIVDRGSSPRPIKKYQTTSKDGVNWIKIGDTKGVEKYIYSTREKITKEGAEHSRFVKEGDFILTNSMSFGNPYIMKTEGYIHDGWFVLRLKEFIDTEFFWFLLVSPFVRNQFNQLASGAIVKNISGDLVKKAVLFIPPLAEQRAIVGRLEALSAETKRLEEIYQSKVDALDEWKKSVLGKAFEGSL